MNDLFAGFRKTVGADNTVVDQQQSRNTMQFGSYKGQLLGTGDSSIARTMEAGRHQFSHQIQTAYDVAGIAVPDDVAAQLEQLDSIAVTSQSIAQMDPMTRVKAIGDGFQEFDQQRILEAESQIMRDVREKAGNIVTIDAQIERDKSIADLTSTQISNATDALTYEQLHRMDQYSQALSNMTNEDLAAAVSRGESLNGVPIAALQSQYIARMEEQSKILGFQASSQLNDLAKALGVPLTGNTAAAAAGANGLGTVNLLAQNLTVEAIEGIITQAQAEHNPEEDGHIVRGAIDVPGADPVMVPVPQLIMARNLLVKQQQEYGESVSKTILAQASAATARYDTRMNSIMTMLNNFGHSVSPDDPSPIVQEMVSRTAGFQQALASGNIEAANAILEDLEEYQAKIEKSMLGPEDGPSYQSNYDILVNGRPVSATAVAASAVNSPAGGLKIGTTPNSVFSETAAVMDQFINRVEADGSITSLITGDEDSIDASSLLSGSSSGGGTSQAERNIARGAAIMSDVNLSIVGEQFANEVRGTIVQDGTRLALQQLHSTLVAAAVFRNDDGSADARLALVEDLQKMLFGKFPQSGSFAAGGGQVAGLLRQEPIPTGEVDADGKPIYLTDPTTGRQLMTTVIDPQRYAQVIDLFDLRLQEAGFDWEEAGIEAKSLSEYIATSLKNNSSAIAGAFVPQTSRDKELMYIASVNYRHNTGDVDGTQTAGYLAQVGVAEIIQYMEAQSATEVAGVLKEIEEAERERAAHNQVIDNIGAGFKGFAGLSLGRGAVYNQLTAPPVEEVVAPTMDELIQSGLTGTLLGN